VKRLYSDAEVRYFLLKSGVALEREVFGKGVPPERVLLAGWDRFVAWRISLPYLKCLSGLQPLSDAGKRYQQIFKKLAVRLRAF
jgi:hypothetical protein